MRSATSPSARLLLERAADAQEAEAALMLAGTYDPQVLGTQDMRSITPDPATARLWYQKAAQLGSSDAQRRDSAKIQKLIASLNAYAGEQQCDVCLEWH